jgi:DNA-binding response OmpR family regulator
MNTHSTAREIAAWFHTKPADMPEVTRQIQAILDRAQAESEKPPQGR